MQDWIFKLISLVVTVASPELRKALEDALNTLERYAEKTANPWDDMLVRLLKSILLNK